MGVPDPPLGEGRYHRAGGAPTWYGSSSEAGAWAEFAHNPPLGTELSTARRRVGHVTFDITVLDLTDAQLLERLGVRQKDLISTDRSTCQDLAQAAIAAGFDAVLGPSAAAPGETTLAVFGVAITKHAVEVEDLGVKRPPVTR